MLHRNWFCSLAVSYQIMAMLICSNCCQILRSCSVHPHWSTKQSPVSSFQLTLALGRPWPVLHCVKPLWRSFPITVQDPFCITSDDTIQNQYCIVQTIMYKIMCFSQFMWCTFIVFSLSQYDVVWDASTSTIVFNSSLPTIVSGRPLGSLFKLFKKFQKGYVVTKNAPCVRLRWLDTSLIV